MKRTRFALWMAACWLVVGAAAQTVDTVIAGSDFPEGPLREPSGLAADTQRNLYLTDSSNNRVVQYIESRSKWISLAGAPSEPEGYQDGRGLAARFFNPRGILYVASGLATNAVLVADYGNHCLRLVSLDGEVTTFAGLGGVPGHADGSLQDARFNYPNGLAMAEDGSVLVADSKNNAIRKIGLDRRVTTVVAGLYEPAAVAVAPTGLSELAGTIWVAETRNHTIKAFTADGVALGFLGSNDRFVSGSTDDLLGIGNALFNNPRGLFWFATGSSPLLLVCDSGNHTVRRISVNVSSGQLTQRVVTTYAGVAGWPGFVDGPLLTAQFNSPIGISGDGAGNVLVVDSANHAVRRLQPTAPQPPVPTPSIGVVVVVRNPQTGDVYTRLDPVVDSIFNNLVNIQIVQPGEVPGTEVYFIRTNVAGILLDLPLPTKSDTLYSGGYRSGMLPSEVPPSMISEQELSPDFVIRALGVHETRKSSDVATARFRFRTAPPNILGDNAASFVISNITEEAQMYFTFDGSEPSPTNGSLALSGSTISFPVEDKEVALKVRAFRPPFEPSPIISKVFSPANYVANEIVFGVTATDPVTRGEASSEFVASAGQRFFAPVTLSLLPAQKIYSLQFNLTVTNASPSAPPVSASDALGFESLLVKPDPPGQSATWGVIPPAMFSGIRTLFVTNEYSYVDTNGLIVRTNFVSIDFEPLFQDLRFTNGVERLLGVGWLERAGATNLYETTTQDLVTYSQPHDTIFLSRNGRVVLGAFSFVVPPTATEQDSYLIRIGRPSATSDGIGRPGSDVVLVAPTNGALRVGKPNSIKEVVIGQRSYIVGDVAPFRWYNAGDFGDTNVLNDDVMQVFQSAAYRLNQPPAGSDFFSAMDSSNAGTNKFTMPLEVVDVTTNITLSVVLTNVTMMVTNTFYVTNLVVTNISVVTTNSYAVNAQVLSLTEAPGPGTIPNLLTYVTNITTSAGTSTEVVTVTNYYAVIASTLASTNEVVTNVFQIPVMSVTLNQILVPTTVISNYQFEVTNIVRSTNQILQPVSALVLDGSDVDTINGITDGDGELDLTDVFVTFRRSLDPALAWYARHWENGRSVATQVPNRFRGKLNTSSRAGHIGRMSASTATGSVNTVLSSEAGVTFEAGLVQGQPGDTVRVPITARVTGGLPLRVLLLNLDVVGLEGAPPLTDAVAFLAGPVLGQPTVSLSRGPMNVAVAWLNSDVAGIQDQGVVGYVSFVIPVNAPINAAYRVQFTRAFGSPNGLGLFAQRLWEGVVTLAGRPASAWADGIPDAWRMRFFGALDNVLAHAQADADGDGVPNWAEFVAGTDPTDLRSKLRVMLERALSAGASADNRATLRWPSVSGKRYVVEATDSIGNGLWQVVQSNVEGTGAAMEFSVDRSGSAEKFYRVRVQD